jgi:hypothetical protein
MRNLVRAVSLVDQVIAMVIGRGFTSPHFETAQRDPYVAFHA